MTQRMCSICRSEEVKTETGIVGPSERVALFVARYGVTVNNPEGLTDYGVDADDSVVSTRRAAFCADCPPAVWGVVFPPVDSGMMICASDEPASAGVPGSYEGFSEATGPDMPVRSLSLAAVVDLYGVPETDWFVHADLVPGWLYGVWIPDGLEDRALETLNKLGIQAAAIRSREG